MSRYRLLPSPTQQAVLRDHCGHARTRENLAVEQHSHWHPGRRNAPGYLEQCRQLTQARAENPWLAAGSQTVQQQALRDFARAMTADPLLAGSNPPTFGLEIRILDRQTGAQKEAGTFNAADYIRPGNPVAPVLLKVPIASLSPGSYVLEVKALRSPGNDSVVRTVEFQVED